ncbi:hypothetical protein RJJ65_17700 [Rhizobium hidalgonense]|uniref:Uncharacterized protein n=1 Tax=Rhizobium hidalgonense TaxID=1538159 RepID=A0AAJ2LMZ1_9HYPH|nr:hypothetical protein [Rhizobium hidalgonense]MDR9774466.1 hypothetical protein [Rhizobium hidalgonense]
MKTAMSTGMPQPRYAAELPSFEWSISMPTVAQMTGSLHIHNFYIGKLRAKQEQLFESDPELAQLLDNVAAILLEHAVELADDIADKEDDDS